jgi:hypothetical protein
MRSADAAEAIVVALRANAGDTAAADAGLRALGSFLWVLRTSSWRTPLRFSAISTLVAPRVRIQRLLACTLAAATCCSAWPAAPCRRRCGPRCGQAGLHLHGATVLALNGAHVLASMCVHAHTPVATAQAQRWMPA